MTFSALNNRNNHGSRADRAVAGEGLS